MNTDQPEETLEEIEQRFVMEWHDGVQPQMVDYINRHPAFATELTDFIMNYIEMKREQEGDLEDLSNAEMLAMRRGLTAALTTTSSLKDRLAEMGRSTNDFADAINLPTAISVMLLKRTISDIPVKLIDRAAKFLNLSLEQTTTILDARPPQRSYGYLLKASSGSAGFNPQVRTFHEALQECKKVGHLTPAQEADWLSEEN